MNDVVIPEKIYLMAPAVHPVTLEINHNKSDNISKNRTFNMEYRNSIHQPAIGKDCYADTKHILDDIGDAGAEAGNTVKAADDLDTSFPFHQFFNKKEKNKKWNCYVQQLAISFHE